MINWKIEKRKIKDLKEYSKNPRTLSNEQAKHLQTSLEKFGLIDKPIINIDNTIIGGHQRLRILKKLKHNEIECYVPDKELNEKEVEELNIRLNKSHGDFDFDTLANEWDALDLVEWGFNPESLIGDEDDGEEKNKKKSKKSKSCPNCGHEF